MLSRDQDSVTGVDGDRLLVAAQVYDALRERLAARRSVKDTDPQAIPVSLPAVETG